MERRAGNLIVQSPGGTAAKGAVTYKVSLPTAWINELGMTGDERRIELSFNGTAITISKRITPAEFTAEKKALGHRLLKLSFYNGEELCTSIVADYSDYSICVENYTNDVLWTAFGCDMMPSWEKYKSFLESRCLSRQRAGLRHYLDVLELDTYDPLEIIKKTGGRMAEDQQWIKVEAIA